jgi:Tfp pilus assembly protein FimT
MKRPRHGKSLIEMLVVIAAMSVVLGFVAQTLHALMRAERAGTQSLAESLNRSRLARQFRQDVHAARQAERMAAEEDQPEQLRLTRPDQQTILWSVANEGFVRSTRHDETIRSQEHYRTGGRGRFELSDDGSRIALVIDPPPALSEAATPPRVPANRRPLRIEAATGRDLRFDSSSTSPNE